MDITTTPRDSLLSAAKILLMREFETLIDNAPKAAILEAIQLKGDQAVAVLLKKPAKALSLEARNEMAIAKMRAGAFERFIESYEALEADTVSEILGISKQALSKKTHAGHVLAYTQGRRKYYPAFQFANGKEKPAVGRLVKILDLNPKDSFSINLLVLFLAQSMNVYRKDEREEVCPRHTLLEDENAFAIIVRDYRNRLEMGK